MHGQPHLIQKFKTEIIRKCIHLLIALTPVLTMVSRNFAVAVLTLGIMLYFYLESLHLSGIKVPFFSNVIRNASRQRDGKRFVLGPVTLGTGALLSLLLLPAAPAAMAVYALAFGDGFASLVGRIFGRIRPSFLFGKSAEGSLSCFFCVLLSSWYVCRDIRASLATAFVATVCEALPLGDFDNIVIPLAAGFTAKFSLAL
jgi:dolichol kinase